MEFHSSNETEKSTNDNFCSANIISTIGDTGIDANINRMKITQNKANINEFMNYQKTLQNTANNLAHIKDVALALTATIEAKDSHSFASIVAIEANNTDTDAGVEEDRGNTADHGKDVESIGEGGNA